jgi:ketosteroid isomerase-like protein
VLNVSLRRAVATAVVVAASMHCVAAAGPADDGARLRGLDRELNRAIAQRDAQRVGELLAEDWVSVSGVGQLRSKADVLAELAFADIDYQDSESRDVLVRIWGDTAVVTGTRHQRYRIRGAQQDVTLRYTDTWTREGDTWRQVSGHLSRLPD